MSPRFESERLAMRPRTPGDADALFAAYGDAEVMRYWSSPPHADAAETRAYLSAPPPWADSRCWAVTVAPGDRAVGTVSAGWRRAGVAEVGYLFARAHQGRGYAREAVSRLLDLLFGEWDARRVFADTDPDNAPSVRLLEALGFRHEGTLRAEWETHIGVRDSLILGLLRDEWRTGR